MVAGGASDEQGVRCDVSGAGEGGGDGGGGEAGSECEGGGGESGK